MLMTCEICFNFKLVVVVLLLLIYSLVGSEMNTLSSFNRTKYIKMPQLVVITQIL